MLCTWFINLVMTASAIAELLKGFDTIYAQTQLTPMQFRCMKDEGYSFYIARVFNGQQGFDIIGARNLKYAHEAGLHVAAYVVPCFSDGKVPNRLSSG
ncbi:unnamed protein product [Cylicocyclus nassatus]|uniref:Hyaluronoglucosaminidase n=1 Tax=Cylicocyclus nassatus TaxID=53992 RepID=A0AA36MG46_CYLNA|nr:unnamed protein product [Cylicocyclus nassatus]